MYIVGVTRATIPCKSHECIYVSLIYTYTYMHTYIYTFIYTCMYLAQLKQHSPQIASSHICVKIYTYKYTYLHTYVYIYTHTHVYIWRNLSTIPRSGRCRALFMENNALFMEFSFHQI